MADNVTYTQPVTHEWQITHYCANCRYWYLEQAVDGFATCHQLVYGKKWRMGTLEQVPQGDAAIVKTYAKFSCKYWENR